MHFFDCADRGKPFETHRSDKVKSTVDLERPAQKIVMWREILQKNFLREEILLETLTSEVFKKYNWWNEFGFSSDFFQFGRISSKSTIFWLNIG
jgi:hypothetical protein